MVVATNHDRIYSHQMAETIDNTQSSNVLLVSFLEFERLGLKKDAKQAALAIVDAVSTYDDKVAWTRNNLHKLQFNRGGRIRHEIFAGIIFPVLKAEFENGDAEASYLLGKYWSNLFSIPAHYLQMGEPTSGDFFRIAFQIEPSSDRYRQAYLDALVSGLRYAFHEWPSGILIDHSNWQGEMCELREEFAQVESLDTDGKYAVEITAWIIATEQYEKHLMEHK
ncbi:MAG: hypothetical protein AAGD04_05090 [Pseudomonadota bacterium]